MLTADHIYYAQNLIIAEMMLIKPHTQWFLDFPVTRKKYNEPTEVSRGNKYQYWTVPGRWESFVAVEKYFMTRSSQELSAERKQLIKGFMTQNRMMLYSAISHAITIENPEMLEDFKNGVFNHEFGQLSRFDRNLFKLIAVSKKIVRKFLFVSSTGLRVIRKAIVH